MDKIALNQVSNYLSTKTIGALSRSISCLRFFLNFTFSFFFYISVLIMFLSSIDINHSGMLKILFCSLSLRSFFANLHVDRKNQRGK